MAVNNGLTQWLQTPAWLFRGVSVTYTPVNRLVFISFLSPLATVPLFKVCAVNTSLDPMCVCVWGCLSMWREFAYRTGCWWLAGLCKIQNFKISFNFITGTASGIEVNGFQFCILFATSTQIQLSVIYSSVLNFGQPLRLA